jgi:hypothetical protein
VGTVVLGYVNGQPISIEDVWLFPGAPEEIVLSWSLVCEDKRTFFTCSDQDDDDDVFQRITYIDFQKPYLWKSNRRMYLDGSQGGLSIDKMGSNVGNGPLLLNTS